LGVGEPVGKVRASPYRQVQVEGLVLAVSEALEPIYDEPLMENRAAPEVVLGEQCMPPEPHRLAHDSGGIAAHLPRHLPVAGAAEQAKEERNLNVGALEVVGGGEGL